MVLFNNSMKVIISKIAEIQYHFYLLFQLSIIKDEYCILKNTNFPFIYHSTYIEGHLCASAGALTKAWPLANLLVLTDQ